MALTVEQKDVKELKERLERLDDRRTEGRTATNHVSVDCGLLEALVGDYETLHRIYKEHPEIRAKHERG